MLTVTSYPTRTSPVLRGKWILENVLNTPPPPPPPGVGSIDAKGGPLAGTMRQQMEKHRADPMCAGCHTRMDPLGFALENYNAIGQWRTHDAGQVIDSSGALPNGKAFKGSAELKAILMGNRDAFAECLTEKVMIYALGRGLEGLRPARAETNHVEPGCQRLSIFCPDLGNRQQRSVPDGPRRNGRSPRHRSAAHINYERRYQMILTRKHVSRRALLRGVGAAMALPVLDSMVPALTQRPRRLKSSRRTAWCLCMCRTGSICGTGLRLRMAARLQLPKILNPLAPVQDDVLVLSGLTGSRRHGFGRRPGDHARASASFLTGVHPKKTAGSDISVGISVDQLAAQKNRFGNAPGLAGAWL